MGVKIIRRFATFVEMLLEKAGEEIRLDLALDAPFRFAPPLLSEYGVLVNAWEDLKAEKNPGLLRTRRTSGCGRPLLSA